MAKKTLFLVRHAKSSWKDDSLPDRERPLNKRGHKNAIEMADRLAAKKIRPDIMISSPAKRAQTTAQYFACGLDYPSFDIQIDERLYFCGLKGILRTIRALPDHFHSVMVFGHNPDMTEFLNLSFGDNYELLPTCTVAKLVFNLESWNDIGSVKAELKFIDAPKRAPLAESLEI